MNPERFRNSTSGRVVKTADGDAAYLAFVPEPLPPDLPLNAELFRSLSDAASALGELAGLGRTMANPHLLIRPFLRREAVLSSRIEGTQADIADVYVYEAGQISLPGMRPVPEPDVREVLNYVGALEYGLERIHSLPVSLRLLCELHERLMQGVRGENATPGEFRTRQNWIGRPGSLLKDAEFVPPPVPQMKEALDALEKYLHYGNQYPPLVRLALIHYQFEAIHPFLDGNGRIGRLLISLLLVHWNLIPAPLLYLSAFFERHRDDYYDLLSAVSERGSWADWVSFFLRGVTEQARDALNRAKLLQDLQLEWRQTLMEKRAATTLLRLVDNLFASPVLTISRAEETLGVTYRAASQNVEKLVTAGILRQAGDSGYARVFVADRILEIVEQYEA